VWRNRQHIFFFKENSASGEVCLLHYRYLDLIFVCMLVVIFSLLVPATEWPDAMDHIARKLAQTTIYPIEVFWSYTNLQPPVLNGEHSVFADHYMYRPSFDYFLTNLDRLPVVMMLVIGLYFLANKVNGELFLFCPPLIYSLASPSQEAIAVFILLAAGIVSQKSPLGTVLLAFLSMIIDRSMVPSAVFLALYAAVAPFRYCVMNRRLVLLAGLLLLAATSVVSPSDLIGDSSNKTRLIYGLAVEDIRIAAEHGQHKFLALAASTMGLYGWMSIRPFPFWIYYPTIMLLFLIGFRTSNPSQQSICITLFLISYLVMWSMPSLAQSRYYPLLTLAFWAMVFSGARAINVSEISFYSFVTLTTIAGCVASLVYAI